MSTSATTASDRFALAEQRLFAAYGLDVEQRRVALADPPLEVAVRESGAGAPVLLVHGSGMNGATWAPVLAQLPDRRVVAVDLPGFGRSDPYDYRGRGLRAHAVAQLTSVLDALDLDRVVVAGTSLGAMWALTLALAAPGRVAGVVAMGMPAVALPGLHPDPFFRLLSTPGLGRLLARAPTPRDAAAARKAMRAVLGPAALERTPDELFDVVSAGMAMPGWSLAMRSHLGLAMRSGRQRPENLLTDDELRAIAVPVRFVWGERDVYGGPEIGRRAAALLPDAAVDVVPAGGHAPFLDAPELCAARIRELSA